MKIDHLVVNVDRQIQEDKTLIQSILDMGLPYKPSWGKGTRGFKVSNLWIGKEYFEFVRIKKPDGGGWIPEWTRQYLGGHRGLIGFALEVENIDELYRTLQDKQVNISPPEPLSFRWFFNRLTKTMPWRNAYLPPFTGMPFQFFLQQMNDEKSRQFMEQYMVPNSRDHGIEGIAEVIIHGTLSTADRGLIYALFKDYQEHQDTLTVTLGAQKIVFIASHTYRVEVVLDCRNPDYAHKQIRAGNLVILNR
ncbi:hypothetical protein C2I18_21515 [Paenibacillus sp. PK3_47]|uniref:VOC family protein n=1 Tax=Paenibacillus sp. PK3_47 TaxID=2072642 RepID=UPI00201D93F9|nr:VOC family protein [Paenibacillus sp. PK3_47]UQZ35884.1 hypothetical protein C2I18_21515 [Paenibacillus sp. PK3_47]